MVPVIYEGAPILVCPRCAAKWKREPKTLAELRAENQPCHAPPQATVVQNVPLSEAAHRHIESEQAKDKTLA